LRRTSAAIPADLETIVLKAMSKDAASRYATAQQMASDLRRFLEHKPIEARRPTLVERGRKWSRRHAALLGVGMAAFAITAVVATTATILTLQAYRSESQQRAAAEDNLMLAADSIDQMLARLAEDRKAHGDIARASTLAVDATEFYEKLLRRGSNPQLVYRAADAYKQVGAIWALVGRYEKAASAHQRGKELLGPLAANGRGEHQAALAENYVARGDAEAAIQQFAAAEGAWRSALAIYEQLARQNPGNVDFDVAVANVLGILGFACTMTNRLDEAEVLYARCTAIEAALPDVIKALPHYWESQGITLTNWAVLVCQRGEFERGVKMFEDSIALQKRAFAVWRSDPAEHHCYRSTHFALAVASASAGRHVDASREVERLVTTCPDHLDSYHLGAELLLTCARILQDDDEATAATYRSRARELVAQAHKSPSRTPDIINQFARFLLTCKDESFRDPARALPMAEHVVKDIPERGAAWHTLALARYRNGRWDAAEEALEQLVRHSVAGRPDGEHWLLLSMIRAREGRLDEARQWHKKASDWIDANETVDEAL
jgi:tetratricopeptide (TPR) repeat protein